MPYLGYSYLGTMQLGDAQLNDYTPLAYVYVNGSLLSTARLGSVSIREYQNSTPNAAQVRVRSVTPVEGNEVKILVGSTAPTSTIFAGTIRTLTQIAEGKDDNVAYDLSVMDYTTLLDRRLVYGTYSNVSATTVVESIISTFTSGFAALVDQAMATVSFSWKGVKVSEALSDVAKAVGAKWKADYFRVVQFHTTLTGFPNPATLTGSNVQLADATSEKDTSQVRTRVFVVWKGSATLEQVLPTFTTMPIRDATTFESGGGLLVTSFGERVTYTGKSANDFLGAEVGGIVYGPTAPVASLDAASGRLVGTYTYKVRFVLEDGLGNNLGESELSVASNAVTAVTVAAPTDPTASVRTGGLRAVTSITRSSSTATVTTTTPHLYSTGDVVSMSGAIQPEYNGGFTITVTGASTFTYTVTGTPATPATGTAILAFVETGGNVPAGDYQYKTTMISATGETLGSTGYASVTVSAVTIPSAPTLAVFSGGPTLVTSITRSGSTATVTISTAVPYTAGDVVTISGLSQPEYNGSFTIQNVTGTFSFTVTVSGTPASPATTTGGSSPPYPALSVRALVDVGGRVGAGNQINAPTYVVTFVTTAGETLGGTTSSTVTISPVTIPTAAVAAQTAGVAGGMFAGVYQYKVAYGTSSGETAITVAPIATGTSTIFAVSAAVGSLGTAQVTGASGNVVGSHYYNVAFITASGQTEVIGAMGSISISTITAPSGGTATPSGSGSLTTGTYSYKLSYTTTNGETLVGSSFSGTVTDVTAPVVSSMVATVVTAPAPGNIRAGSYSYIVTYVTSAGETTIATGSIPSATITQISNSASSFGTPVQYVSGFGALTGKSLNYLLTDMDENGETTGTASGTITMGGGNDSVSVLVIASSDSRSIKRRLYRRDNGDGLGYLLLAEIPGNAGIVWNDVYFNNQRVSNAPPGANTTGNGQINLTTIPTSGDARVVRRNIYRKLGSGTYYFLASIGDNSTTAFTDNRAETDLQPITVPGANTTGFAQMALTSLPTSGDGRVNGRVIYRTRSGGSTYFALTRIDSTTTTFTDNTPDTGLGASPLSTSTADNGYVNISSIPVSSDGRVTGRAIYRSKNGTTDPKYLVTTINDNTTTIYTDNVSDDSLTSVAPSVNTTNTGQMSLSSVPISSDQRVLTRVIYRTKAGGSVYYRLTTISDNVTTTYVDSTPDSSLTDEASSLDTSGGAQVRVTAIAVSSDSRVHGRRLYRLPFLGTAHQLVATLNDNTTTTYLDNVADVDLGQALPTFDTSGGAQVRVSGLVVSGDAHVIARGIYRLDVTTGDLNYYRVARVNDNILTSGFDNTERGPGTTILPDQDPDRLVSTFGGNTVSLASIPLGPTNTVARRLFRTLANTDTYRFLHTITDNTTTIYTDNSADDSLGADAVVDSTVAIVAGSTTIPTNDTSVFSSTGGWVTSGSQAILYTGRSTTSGPGNLTGVPATGVGSIASNLKPGADLVNAPFLKGISGNTQTLARGDAVNPIVQGDDTAAQTAMAAKEGGDGIHEMQLWDETILTQAGAVIAYQAEFSLFSEPEQRASFKTRDYKAVPGAMVTVNIPAPTSLSMTVPIISTVVSDIGYHNTLRYPLRTIELADSLFTLQDLLGRVHL